MVKENILNGAEKIAAERKKQIDSGWTIEEDVIGNNNEQLSLAAGCYAFPEVYRGSWKSLGGILSENWPWQKKYWKPSPKNRIDELVKAGALAAAEIDRLLYLENRDKIKNKTTGPKKEKK